MQQQFTIVRQNRKILYNYLTNLSEDELFTIPKAFNNNIWWNIAHVVVTQQILVYKLSGLPMNISEYLVAKYKKGTSPKSKPSDAEVAEIKKLLFELPEQTEADYDKGMFKDFNAYMTTPKIELTSVEDAIQFNSFHEGLHLGSILALHRAANRH